MRRQRICRRRSSPPPRLSFTPSVLPSIHPPYLQPSLPISTVCRSLSTYLQPLAHLFPPSLPPSSLPSSNRPFISPSIPRVCPYIEVHAHLYPSVPPSDRKSTRLHC